MARLVIHGLFAALWAAAGCSPSDAADDGTARTGARAPRPRDAAASARPSTDSPDDDSDNDAGGLVLPGLDAGADDAQADADSGGDALPWGGRSGVRVVSQAGLGACGAICQTRASDARGSCGATCPSDVTRLGIATYSSGETVALVGCDDLPPERTGRDGALQAVECCCETPYVTIDVPVDAAAGDPRALRPCREVCAAEELACDPTTPWGENGSGRRGAVEARYGGAGARVLLFGCEDVPAATQGGAPLTGYTCGCVDEPR